ncbi:MAG: synthase, Delta/Epsilon chain, beta-sandwich domain, partial [Pseudomonadota bacterium]
MADNILLEIVTPKQVAYSKAVDSVIISGVEGDMEIFKDHISLITFLKAGKIIAKIGSNITVKFSTSHFVIFLCSSSTRFLIFCLILLAIFCLQALSQKVLAQDLEFQKAHKSFSHLREKLSFQYLE